MIILEILKYTLPSVVVFLTAYFILKQVFDNQKERHQAELKNQLIIENSKLLTPARMQAYERMVLFLERIAPMRLVLRQNQADLNVVQFQKKLIQVVREEFEHNLSQQLYISSKAWNMVFQAKEEVISIINTAANQLKPEDSSAQLGKLIINAEEFLKKPIVKGAIDMLREELKFNLG